jgi:hypothetical protein
MQRMRKSIFIVLFIVISGSTFGQNNTSSPYSKMGLGEFERLGFGRNTAMGNAGIALKSTSNVNILNPASYTSIDSTMVLYELGLHGSYTQMNTTTETGDKINANLSYMGIGMAINSKWAMAFGVSPYTSVGYKIRVSNDMYGGGGKYITDLEGSGGLTVMYGGLAYRPWKNSSFGVNALLLFGPKKETEYLYVTGNDIYEVTHTKSNSYSGFKADFGFQQTLPISKYQNLTLGVVINPPGILRNEYTMLQTKSYPAAGIYDTLEYENNVQDYIKLPTNYSVGLAYNYKNQLTLTGDFSYNPWSKMRVNDDFSDMIDNYIYAFGAEYCPAKFGHQFDLALRTGASYESGYYKVLGHNLHNLSVTAGVGFRIKAIRFDLYGAYSWRGTYDDQLIKETNLRFGLNIAYIDYWFQKRKFN